MATGLILAYGRKHAAPETHRKEEVLLRYSLREGGHHFHKASRRASAWKEDGYGYYLSGSEALHSY